MLLAGFSVHAMTTSTTNALPVRNPRTGMAGFEYMLTEDAARS